MQMILDNYRRLLGELDARSAELFDTYRPHLRCRRGCSFCCDAITVLPIEIEALRQWMLREQPQRLAPELHGEVVPVESVAGSSRAAGAPAGNAGNGSVERPRVSVDRTMEGTLPAATLPDSRCALLDGDGACTVYAGRPVICRTHGLPLAYRVYEYDAEGLPVDHGGPEYMDLWCDLNFTSIRARSARGFFDRHGRINMDDANNRLAARNAEFLRTPEGAPYVGCDRLVLGWLVTGGAREGPAPATSSRTGS